MRNCMFCGEPMVINPRGRSRRFCDDICRYRRHAAEKSNRRRNQHQAKYSINMVDCGFCGTCFIPVYESQCRSYRYTFCSPQCRARSYRQQKNGWRAKRRERELLEHRATVLAELERRVRQRKNINRLRELFDRGVTNWR